MSIVESARQYVLRELPHDRGNPAVTTPLNAMDAGDLLLKYHNWMTRHVAAVPRTVHLSKAIQSNLLIANNTRLIDHIIQDIEQGRDLKKYLSRGINTGFAPPSSKGVAKDKDLMLNDWGVHHLHISDKIEPDGFVERGGPILFAVFRQTDAFLIDIMNHGDWVKESVLKIMIDEWPGHELLYRIRGAAGLTPSVSQQGRAVLRKAHTNALFEHGGYAYAPVGGLMTDGTSTRAFTAVQILMDKIRTFDDLITNRLDELRQTARSQGVEFPSIPVFEFIITDKGAGVVEIETGTMMYL